MTFICAMIVTLLVSALPFGIAFAHGNQTPTKAHPQSCFYYDKATASRTYYSGAVYIGTIEVWVAESSCVPSNFVVGGHFDGTGGGEVGCDYTSVVNTGKVNGVEPGSTLDSSASTSSFGVSSCSMTILSAQSGAYGAQHGDTISGCNVVKYGTSTQPQLCTSYTY